MNALTTGASAPSIFNFNSHAVRVIVRDDAPWFVAADVADALEYRNAPDMTRFLDDDEAATHNLRIRSESGVEQGREVTIISESGLYHAVLKSRKPKARPFRRWVTGEVLPAIRKTGRYESSAAITSEQAGELFQLVAERFPEGSDRPYAWSRFNNHFRIARYRELPAHRFAEACAYIRHMPEREAPALPAPAAFLKPLVWTRPMPSCRRYPSQEMTGAPRTAKTVETILDELIRWAIKEVPGEAGESLRTALEDLSGLVITGWTEVDEALSTLSFAMRYLNRWQDRDGRIGNIE
ncbi:MAG: Bro-N domain-containing protein [Zoogloeaceae bacterium]|jgi:prophage antirepressor-like protein|nr:Bro-N domain-containing protein [Zoogloeaceae bacterium]